MLKSNDIFSDLQTKRNIDQKYMLNHMLNKQFDAMNCVPLLTKFSEQQQYLVLIIFKKQFSKNHYFGQQNF